MSDRCLVLASASPQRTRLLDQLGLAHRAIAADIDESPHIGESAEALAERLARGKAQALASAHSHAVIVGSDTVVALDNRIFGKPHDAMHAATMLGALAGRSHRVVSAVAVIAEGTSRSRIATSAVTLRAMDNAEIDAYIDSGEPFGKAGAYAIQGLGALFVERLEGSYSAVMGLPLFETGALLRAVGIDPLPTPQAAT